MKLRTIGKLGKQKIEVFIEVVIKEYLGSMIKLNISFLLQATKIEN